MFDTKSVSLSGSDEGAQDQPTTADSASSAVPNPAHVDRGKLCLYDVKNFELIVTSSFEAQRMFLCRTGVKQNMKKDAAGR